MYKVIHPAKQFSAYDPDRPPHFTLQNSPDDFMNLMAAIAPKSSEHDEQRLLAFYRWVDAIMHELRESAVCERGCAHCCKQPVSVTPLEIELAKFSPQFSQAPEFDPNTGYCPFLDKQSAQCTIYQLRPLACRAFLTLDDPSYCKNGNAVHYTFTMDQLTERLPDFFPNQDATLYAYLAGEINKLFAGERSDFRVCARA